MIGELRPALVGGTTISPQPAFSPYQAAVRRAMRKLFSRPRPSRTASRNRAARSRAVGVRPRRHHMTRRREAIERPGLFRGEFDTFYKVGIRSRLRHATGSGADSAVESTAIPPCQACTNRRRLPRYRGGRSEPAISRRHAHSHTHRPRLLPHEGRTGPQGPPAPTRQDPACAALPKPAIPVIDDPSRFGNAPDLFCTEQRAPTRGRTRAGHRAPTPAACGVAGTSAAGHPNVHTPLPAPVRCR